MMVTYRTAARAAQDIKAALVAATQTLFAADDSILVTFGHPGQQLANFDDIVAWTDWATEQEPATLSMSKRTRDAQIRQQVVVSCVRPGGHEAEPVAAEAATAIIEAIEDYLRDTDPTIGGRAWKVLTADQSAQGATDPDSLANGRTVEVSATVVAYVRLTN